MAKQPTERRYVADFIISIGIMEVTGDLRVPRVSDAGAEEKFVSMCPTCASNGVASQVKQTYQCTVDSSHGPFTIGDCSKGKEIDGKWILFSRDQVAEARASQLPSNVINVQVHRKEEVESKTMASGNKWFFTPRGSSKLYGILLDFLSEDSEYSLIGLVNIRKQDKIVRLNRALNNQLIVEELIWPEDVKILETPSYEYAPELLGAATAFIAKACQDFSPDSYTKQARQRISTMVDVVAKTGAAPSILAPTQTPKDEDEDLMALFKTALEG